MKINLNTIIPIAIGRKLILLFIVVTLTSFVHAQQLPGKANETAFPKTSQFHNAKLTYQIIDAGNKTFGYDIYADGRIMIHQPSVPAFPGNEGFTTKAGAVKIAQLAMSKIKNGEMPPTVTIEEMKKLKVTK
jgi:hypothetical protein